MYSLRALVAKFRSRVAKIINSNYYQTSIDADVYDFYTTPMRILLEWVQHFLTTVDDPELKEELEYFERYLNHFVRSLEGYQTDYDTITSTIYDIAIIIDPLKIPRIFVVPAEIMDTVDALAPPSERLYQLRLVIPSVASRYASKYRNIFEGNIIPEIGQYIFEPGMHQSLQRSRANIRKKSKKSSNSPSISPRLDQLFTPF